MSVVVVHLVPPVDHAELRIHVLVELRFDAHAETGEVLHVDELVRLGPVGVGDGLDHLHAHEGDHPPHLELHPVPARGRHVQGDVEMRDVGLGAQVEPR